MKKFSATIARVSAILLALAMIAGSVSCHKDDEKIDPTPLPGDNDEPAYEEGVFNPGRHVSSIKGDGFDQSFTWDNSNPRLLLGYTDYETGQRFSFEYSKSNRMINSTCIQGGSSVVYNFTYVNDRLEHFAALRDGKTMGVASVEHENNKISAVHYTQMDPTYVASLLGFVADLTKMEITTAYYDVYYHYEEENMDCVIGGGQAQGYATVGQIYELVGDDIWQLLDIGDQYASFLELFLQEVKDQRFPFVIDMNDTTDITYDTCHNVLYGCFCNGLLFRNKILTPHNYLVSDNHGIFSISGEVQLELPEECPDWVPEPYAAAWASIRTMLCNHPFPITSTRPVKNYSVSSYEYDASGYPTVVVQDGKRINITYLD